MWESIVMTGLPPVRIPSMDRPGATPLANSGRVIWDDCEVGVCDQEKARSDMGALFR